MAAFREAEARGLDLDRALPALVQGRTVSSADDIAALIHGRVTKWIESAGGRERSDSIAGLGPAAVGVTDHDVDQALQERRTLIEARARTLVLEAFQRRDPWILGFGRLPEDPSRRDDWLRGLDTVAAYRERWQINAGLVLGEEPRSHEQTAHCQLAQRAVLAALGSARADSLAQDIWAAKRQSSNPEITDGDYSVVERGR
jgi:hypothetical protein